MLLISGSRRSGKTRAALHRVMRHLWETPGARVAMFADSIKLAKDNGVWVEFQDVVIPEWMESGMVGKFGQPIAFTTFDSQNTPGVKTDTQTKTMFFKIRNFHGGESEMRLFSIDNGLEAAKKLKGKIFSMVYFAELTMFNSEKVLANAIQTFRVPHLRNKMGVNGYDHNHQFIADTNPDEEIGMESWVYKKWYIERIQEKHKKPAYQQELELVEMFASDNPHNSKEDVDELEASCENDPALFDSWVRGIWGSGGRKRRFHFADVFTREIHVVGDESEPEIALNPSSTQLITGWDLGGSVNHAAVILDKWLRRERGKEVSCWSIVQEVASIQEQMMIEDFTLLFVEQMDRLEKMYNRKFQWTHWSDDSSITMYHATSGTYDYLQVAKASGGRIELLGVEKMDTVKSRVRMIRRLLAQKRLFVSFQCERTIEMFEKLMQGETQKDFVVWNENKHLFDAISYPLFEEEIDDLQESINSRPQSAPSAGRIITL